jgi:hypothetical protein
MTPIWPHEKRFAFTVFDDTDSQTRANGEPVYNLLCELGFRTTKSVWPSAPVGTPSDPGATCADPDYRAWVQSLAKLGFEVGYHMATSHTSPREFTIAALDQFKAYFGGYPRSMANHYFSGEDIYFGDARLSGAYRAAYNLLTRNQNRGRFRGHIEGDPLFWGDVCRERIWYVRNFVFRDINTLAACPEMPYHDPDRPYVNRWFASTEGATISSFLESVTEANLDRLEADGGCCIMYTHFGLGFCQEGVLDPRFVELMQRLSRRKGWFVPVSTLLDYMESQRGPRVLTDSARRRLERKWLWHKIRFGTA